MIQQTQQIQQVTKRNTFTNIQARALERLAEGLSIVEVSRTIHRSRKTIHLWLRDPQFQAALQQLQSQALNDVSRRLVALADVALSVLEGLLMQAGRGDHVKRSASVAVLELLLKYRMAADMEARIQQLERMVLNNA